MNVILVIQSLEHKIIFTTVSNMELNFYEMHFEATEQPKLEGNTDACSFSLLCMTSNGHAFCSLNDKVYHILWNHGDDDLERRLCFTPGKDGRLHKDEIILLDALHTDAGTIVAVVYYHDHHGGQYTLSVFQVDLNTLKLKAKQEENLHKKPNLVRLSRDLYSSHISVFATYYSDPCVQVFQYTYSGFISKVEDIKVKEHYPGLFKCMFRAVADKRTLSREDHHSMGPEKRAIQEYILCIDVLLEGDMQYLAYGTVDGNIHVQVSSSHHGVAWQAMYDWEGPISAIRIFKVKGYVCLVGACMVEQVILITDINHTNKLHNRIVLPESNLFDSVTCLSIMDIDYDGDSEILVGTYGRMFLVYKLHLSEANLVPYIVYRRHYNSPIYGICHSDITDDGIHEIIVLTFNGIHVLQRCLRSAQQYIQKLIDSSGSTQIKCPFQSEHFSDNYASTPEY